MKLATAAKAGIRALLAKHKTRLTATDLNGDTATGLLDALVLPGTYALRLASQRRLMLVSADEIEATEVELHRRPAHHSKPPAILEKRLDQGVDGPAPFRNGSIDRLHPLPGTASWSGSHARHPGRSDRGSYGSVVAASPLIVEQLGNQLEALGWVTDLFVGGSLSTGDYTPFVSDLDLVALVNGPVGDLRQSTLTSIHRSLDEGMGAGLKMGCTYVDAARLYDHEARHPTWTHGSLVQRTFRESRGPSWCTTASRSSAALRATCCRP